jgi:hypothetical protein
MMNHAKPGGIPLADSHLSLRLEYAEAWSNREFIDSRSRTTPGTAACWKEIGGAFVMFDFPGSPLTQTFGLGMKGPVLPADIESIESFFRDHGADTFHEVSPLADPSALALLNDRGYHPVEFTNVLYRTITGDDMSVTWNDAALRVRQIRAEEEESWSATSSAGWGEFPGLSAFMRDLGRVFTHQNNARLFLAELDGSAVATGILHIHGGVALFAGASTIPSARKRGAQLALLHARLRFAHESGCDLAMMCAQPGSASQRNAERHGFRIAYTRTKWHLGPVAATGEV